MARRALIAAISLAWFPGGAGCATSMNEYLLLAQKGDVDQVHEAIVGIGQELRARETSGFEWNEGEIEALEFLRETARASPDPLARSMAISQLYLLAEPDSLDVFVGALDDDHFAVRWDAAKALARHPDASAAELVARRLVVEERPEIHIDLIAALGAVGGEDALRVLLRSLLDPFRGNKLTTYEFVRALSGKEWAFEDDLAWASFYEERFGTGPEPLEAGGLRAFYERARGEETDEVGP